MGWLLIGDKPDPSIAPWDGSHVLLADSEHVSTGFYVSDEGRVLIAADKPYWQPYDHSYWDRTPDDPWFQPTHWAPLPPPPTSPD